MFRLSGPVVCVPFNCILLVLTYFFNFVGEVTPIDRVRNLDMLGRLIRSLVPFRLMVPDGQHRTDTFIQVTLNLLVPSSDIVREELNPSVLKSVDSWQGFEDIKVYVGGPNHKMSFRNESSVSWKDIVFMWSHHGKTVNMTQGINMKADKFERVLGSMLRIIPADLEEGRILTYENFWSNARRAEWIIGVIKEGIVHPLQQLAVEDYEIKQFLVVQTENKKAVALEDKWKECEKQFRDRLTKDVPSVLGWSAGNNPNASGGGMSTFCAVVYQLLKDTFFMEGSSGALLRCIVASRSEWEQIRPSQVNMNYDFFRDDIFYPLYYVHKYTSAWMNYELDYINTIQACGKKILNSISRTAAKKGGKVPSRDDDKMLTIDLANEILEMDGVFDYYSNPDYMSEIHKRRKGANSTNVKMVFDFRCRALRDILDVINKYGMNPDVFSSKIGLNPEMNKMLRWYLRYDICMFHVLLDLLKARQITFV